MAAAITGETVIDSVRRNVRRGWKLFEVIPLLFREYCFDAFREVRWRTHWIQTEVDSNHWVELVLKSGRSLILTTFLSYEPDRSCPGANALALELAEILGLPLSREPDRTKEQTLGGGQNQPNESR